MNFLKTPCLALLVMLIPSALRAEEHVPWWPGSAYDQSVPTPESALGHVPGEYYTEHWQMIQYMRLLERTSPRVKVFHVGHSLERREILLLAVSSPANISRLEETRLAMSELRDPRRTDINRAREIAESHPAVAWMNFANDGNETAAFEAGIQLAYQLAAGQDDDTLAILEHCITIIYPSHNPDSHSRHVAWMKASAMGNPDAAAQEHRGDWRMDTNNNHYQIDLNRDAVFLSQPESRLIVHQIHRWNPVVFVDHHGNPDRFFFPPWATPVNDNLDENAHRWVETYGRNIARVFDQHGWTYFTRNVFDLHYPGYYDSYPSLNGATGMTFETDGGGNKGLAYRLPDGRITTLRDGALHHFSGSMAVLLTTARNRDQRLFDFYRFRASGMEQVQTEPVKQFVFLPGADPQKAADLVNVLLKHQIEVKIAEQVFRSSDVHSYLSNEVTGREFPAGSYLVSTQQPQKRLLRALLDRESPLEEGFLESVKSKQSYNMQVGKNAPKQGLGFYDITAWSLPLAFGVESYWTEDTYDGPAQDVTEDVVQTVTEPTKARFAYLFPWGNKASTQMVMDLWREDYRVNLASEAFVLKGRHFKRGTVVVRTQPNPDSLHRKIRDLAARHVVEVIPSDTALVEEGKDLGDASVVDLIQPSIAVISEEPTRNTAYGAIWSILESTYGVPFTAIKAADLSGTALSDYDVLVLPDGSAEGYARVFDATDVQRLKNWVREGGALVSIKGAAEWAAREAVGLTGYRLKRTQELQSKEDSGPSESEEAILPMVPGALVNLNLDAFHYLTLGVVDRVFPLVRSDFVFEADGKGGLVGWIDKTRPVVAGFSFEESRRALAGAPFLWDERTGRGHVICFADDVTFRTFLHGSHQLFLNSILLSSSRWSWR